MDLRFLRCNACGNLVIFQYDSGVTPNCCGDEMEELVAGSTDGAAEKHVPMARVENMDAKADKCSGTRFTQKGSCDCYVTVQIGEAEHPMADDHYIEWVVLQTNCGTYTRFFDPGDKPCTTFCLGKGEKPIKVYSYCNLHGLWVSKDL